MVVKYLTCNEVNYAISVLQLKDVDIRIFIYNGMLSTGRQISN